MKERRTGLRLAVLLAGLAGCGGCGDAGNGQFGGTPSPEPGTRSASVAVESAGVGTLDVLVSTIVDPTWESWLFERHPTSAALLRDMGQQHTLIVLDENTWEQVVPQIGRDPKSPSSWSFARLDAIVQPMLEMGDHSPDFMIAAAPPHMYDANHAIADRAGFAEYAANLVRYYNGPGIALSDGTTLRSPSPHPVRYWSLLNETHLSGTEYLALYDTAVPAMQAVDPDLNFVAAEIAWGHSQQVHDFLRPFLAGVRSRVDVLGIHFFPAGQQDSDQRVFDYVPECAANVRTLYGLLGANPRLAGVPVWITSYNTTSWGGLDARPTSPFYAAWAPYLLARTGRAGARSLHHWEFAANVQFGEIDQETGRPFVSYWVDLWLGRYFSQPPGQEILALSSESDPANIETLAVRRADGSVVVMVVNHAVANASDNNGRGAPYTVSVDVSALGAFGSATVLTIDASTDLTIGPVGRRIPAARAIPLTLSGYGVGFVTLRP